MGVNTNGQIVRLINAGFEPFPGEAGLQKLIRSMVPSGALRATTSYEDAAPDLDVVVVVVPRFVDGDNQPDFGWMDSVTDLSDRT